MLARTYSMPIMKTQKELADGKWTKVVDLLNGHMDEVEELFHDPEGYAIDEQEGVFRKVQQLESCMSDIFATISSLKQAYVQLQAAHSPYDADKIRLFDRAIISEMKKLSDLKRTFYEKQEPVSSSRRQSAVSEMKPEESRKNHTLQKLEKTLKEKQKLVDTYEGYIEQFQRAIGAKDVEINGLKSSLEEVTEKVEDLERRARTNLKGPPVIWALPESALTSQLFEMTVTETKKAASSFSFILLKRMKEAEWDLDAASQSIEPGIFYPKPAHKKFAFESYVCHRMFNGFEKQNFSVNNNFSSILNERNHKHDCLLQLQDMRFIDPFELVNISPDCLFGRFCHKKYLQTVHQKMEESFFGNLQQRSQVLNGDHPTSTFYKSFLKLAKSVWLLHLLAFAVTPTISIFQVRRETMFHPLYMESVITPDDSNCLNGGVGLTVFPGFCLEKQILRCQVYLNGISLQQ
ncbi:hypothetical protein O6H91_12G036200 [Diphasiastrum complanatum]|uniref:Uncharacterized protein n=1 Tax=Diphasiastrum complanatum TaxID=34168 RepID=A0ACC2C0F6_DIPCM|nr:hypothetical protein O6H91_12G036200 [Diphasiastrum complanatum]